MMKINSILLRGVLIQRLYVMLQSMTLRRRWLFGSVLTVLSDTRGAQDDVDGQGSGGEEEED